uniref:Uncharacterized protein n=1 Tax=Populus davidiana TaxID=266767 RepID=A0A6M2EJU6_9ROSI
MANLVAGRTSSFSPPLQWLAVTLAHSGFGQKQRRLGKKREGLGSVGLLVQGEEDGATSGIEAETSSLGLSSARLPSLWRREQLLSREAERRKRKQGDEVLSFLFCKSLWLPAGLFC